MPIALSAALPALRDNALEIARRLPPQNVPAEKALLGAIFVNNRAFERVSEFLRAAQTSSPWLDSTELVEIKAVLQPPAPGSREQRRLFEFSMRVSMKQPGAAASAPAASAPLLPAPKPA